MNYYIQGDAANADRIRAAFEKKGFIKEDHRDIYENNVLFFTVDGDKNVHFCWLDGPYCNIIKTHPDYKELGMPKPHYDIANFHAGMSVLVRPDNDCCWDYSVFSRNTGNEYWPFAVCNGVSFTQCIPFNEDTKHLLGTTDMPDEMYINW